jgi:iron complex transport system ATP-binding protein
MAVKIRNLTFSYAGRPVLDAIDLDIQEGCFTVVMGKNGSGKSTLFRLLAGFLTPREGNISLLGRPLRQLSDRERARLLGFLPQHHRPVFPFRVEDVVLTGRAGHIRLIPGKEDRRHAGEALAVIGIEHLRERIFTELSGGEQQLVMIARVIAQNPHIILFDEPTTHLDFFYQDRVLKVIRELTRMRFTVIAVLHDPNIAALYGDHFVCLKNGRVLHESHQQSPDAAVLADVYGMHLAAIPFQQKTLVFPTDSFASDRID